MKPTKILLQYSALAAWCLLTVACHRGPQTAAELQGLLPRQYRGELNLQGETTPRQIVVEPHDYSVRTEHVLAFNGVRYQVLAGGNVLAEGDTEIHGTITTPDLVMAIESVGSGEANDALKAGTFQGKLTSDLQEAEATWKSGLDQTVHLKAKAVR